MLALIPAERSISVGKGWVMTPLVKAQIEERSKASGRTFQEEKVATDYDNIMQNTCYRQE